VTTPEGADTYLRKLRDRGYGDSIGDVKDQPALADLVAGMFEQYHTAIFAYLYRLVSDREWAHDLTQETFLRLFRTRHRLPQVENRRAWVYRIATNLAFNALKRRQRFTWLPWRNADAAHLTGPDPSEQADRRVVVEQALAELPPQYRAPLLLHSHYGFSVCETAKALGISEGAVKTRLYRAREMFRQVYEREDEGGSHAG
jgi:RNA polymerase sigma-70 factor (ECF subfamily)